MYKYNILIIKFTLLILFASCSRKNSQEIIKNATKITYSNFELNQYIRIQGSSDTALILKKLFLDVYEQIPVKDISFRDATDLNKIIFYYDGKFVTTWINCLHQNQIVFGIEDNKYVLDTIAEQEAIQRVSETLGLSLTSN